MEPRYWCPIAEDWTDPPRHKSSKGSRQRTHVLKDGAAMCGKRSPAWFYTPGRDRPTCEKCLDLLSRMTQSERMESELAQ